MSLTKAAVKSFDECNVFEKAAQLSVIVYDNTSKLNDSNDEAFSINTVCNCRSRYDKFVYFNRPHTHGIRVRDREPGRIPNKAREKIYAHGIRCGIKEQRIIPLLQSEENLQSLTNTGYWKCKTNIHIQ